MSSSRPFAQQILGHFALTPTFCRRSKEAKTAESAVEDATPASPSPQAGAIRYRKDGGIDSEGGDGAQEVYWLGVIDVLQVRCEA